MSNHYITNDDLIFFTIEHKKEIETYLENINKINKDEHSVNYK